MKKRLSIICIAALVTITFNAPALATDMFGYFKDKQLQALPAIINHCLLEGDDEACAVSMRNLVQAEMGLVSYGKNYLDEDLYSRLSSGLEEHQHRHFAWRVLKERLRKNNCSIESAGSVFP